MKTISNFDGSPLPNWVQQRGQNFVSGYRDGYALAENRVASRKWNRTPEDYSMGYYQGCRDRQLDETWSLFDWNEIPADEKIRA